IFVPFLQTNVPVRYVAIRTKIEPASVLSILRQEVAAMDKTLAVSKVRTMEQLIGDAKTGPRFSMLLFSLFGVFACILAGVGVYGLVADSVMQRRREMGIRMALGAQRKGPWKHPLPNCWLNRKKNRCCAVSIHSSPTGRGAVDFSICAPFSRSRSRCSSRL